MGVFLAIPSFYWGRTDVSTMDFSNHRFPTTVTTGVNSVNSTVTTVSHKGENYLKIDALYDSLGDLVNERFKAWYCQQFQALGRDTVLTCAAIARQESKTDKRKYFSYLLKNYKPR